MKKFSSSILALVILVFVVLVVKILFGAKPQLAPTSTPEPPIDLTASLSADLMARVNQWRLASSLEAYFWDADLCNFADLRLSQIQNAVLSHSAFYEQAQDVFPDSGFASLAENLASFSSLDKENLELVSEEILLSWLASRSHQQNLEDDFSHSCLRCNSQICIQVFGRY